MKVKILILLLISVLTGATSTVGISMTPARDASKRSNKYEVAGIEDAASVAKFLRKLQITVAKNKRANVASMVDYPVTVIIAKRKVTLRKRADLLRRYTLVFNRKVKQALARQKVEKLFVNQQGVMIGDGEIWFNQPPGRKELKIIAINN